MDRYYIWGFPGIGKSSISKSPDILDADCRLFQFAGASSGSLHNTAEHTGTIPDPAYPQNYLDHIRSADSRYILLNCHISLLRHLPRENLLLIYPDMTLKYVYLKRYQDRGDNGSFISYMDESFANIVHAIESYPCRKLRITGEHTYLTDILKGDFLMNEFMTKHDLTTLLNEAIRYDLLGPEVTGDYARVEDIAQAILRAR